MMLKYGIFAIVLLFSQQVKAHDGYPPECCGGNDCAQIDEIVTLDDGSMRVTTKHGVAIFPKDFKIRPSFDEKQHACFQKGMASDGSEYTIRYCLFLQAGS